MSNLARHAIELTGVLHGIIRCLNQYDDPLGAEYAARLSPLVLRLEHAVIIACDANLACSIMPVINQFMHTVNGAATKGEHRIFPDDSDLLSHYWDLSEIFSEAGPAKLSLHYDWQRGNWESR